MGYDCASVKGQLIALSCPPRRNPTHQFDTSGRTGSACQPGIAGEKHGIQGLRESHVGRIVCSEILSKLPYPVEKRLVSMAVQIQIVKIVDSRRRFRQCELALPRVTPKRLCDLYINNVWRVQTLP
jgi:hypothetical protein